MQDVKIFYFARCFFFKYFRILGEKLPNISEVFLKSNELENKFRACIECGTHINKSFLFFCDFIFI